MRMLYDSDSFVVVHMLPDPPPGADAADALYDAGKHGASLIGGKRAIVAFLRQAFRRSVRPDAV